MGGRSYAFTGKTAYLPLGTGSGESPHLLQAEYATGNYEVCIDFV